MDELSSIPGAPGRLPVLGHLVALARNPFRFLESLRTVGEIVRVDAGNWPVYMVTTPKLVREALVTRAGSLARGRIYDRARILFGDGLATSEGSFHRQRRRLVQPAFHQQRIAGYADAMRRHTDALIASWEPGQRVAIDRVMHELTLRIVADALFSVDVDSTSIAEVQQHVPTIMRGIAARMLTPRYLDRWPIPSNIRFDAASARLRAVVMELIASRRRSNREREDLLSVLLAAQDTDRDETMSDAQVCDEVISLLIAGTETPATTLSWAFHALAARPEVEQRLHSEVDSVAGGLLIDADKIGKLEYTGRVLNEVLRLHPVLVFTRRATSETQIGGWRIPAGTEIAYSPYALHRDPEVYPDPTRFDPDRWLPGRAADLAPRTFNPFGAGHHKCIGDSFAWTEMNIVVASIARHWRLRLAAGHSVREAIAEVPRPDALPMIVQPRRA
jgi:cytochrome P450